ncbi:MAG: LysM peptidoglycan-binding domain-containing protein [Caldilineaceae bacterium]|nr:LysM peptidoglycan-binding domain-containing protein [Caldilineaceae bacterium]
MNNSLLPPLATGFVRSGPLRTGLWRLRIFGLICLITGIVLAGLPSKAWANDDPSQLSPDGERAAILINQLRANAGLPPLRVHPLLTLAANLHIQNMTSTGVYGHTGSDGSSVHTRVARTGYVTSGWNGENWAVYDTVDTSIGWWMTDPPHRDNVLNASYTEMGIGTAPHPNGWGLILVVDFSTGNANGAEGVVPGVGEAVAASQVVAPALVDLQPVSLAPVSDSGLRYRVSPGDTLFSIGQRYGVDWQSIARLNSLGNGSVLQIGAELRIPGGGVEQTSAAVVAPSSAAPPVEGSPYTVAGGDTLVGIALRFGMTWQTLAAANGLGEQSLLQIGDVLTIPGQSETAAQAPVSVARSHTVQAGETIWVIAAQYGVDWRTLLQTNGLSEQALLQIGQVLTLP